MALCLAIIPYKYCYYVASMAETPTEVRIRLEKNPFFTDCTTQTKKVIDTEKDVLVIKDGEENLYTNAEICSGQQ